MTEDELMAIEERVNAATPGPWVPSEGWEWTPRAEIKLPISDNEYKRIAETLYGSQRNTGFVAHARMDVPALIAEVRRLKQYARHTRTCSKSMAEWFQRPQPACDCGFEES